MGVVVLPSCWARSWPRRSRARPTIPGMRSDRMSPNCSRWSGRWRPRPQSSATRGSPGFQVGIAGSLWLLGLVAVIGIPVGDRGGGLPRGVCPPGRLRRFIQMNIANLAGVPSIVYGILGLAVFVRAFGVKAPGLGPDPAGRRADAQPADPADHRDHDAGGVACRSAVAPPGGAGTRGDPLAGRARSCAAPGVPGILTGTILGLSRAIGETAPLLMVGAAGSILRPPEGPSIATRPSRWKSTITPEDARPRIPGRRRRRHPDPRRALAHDECHGHRDPQPLPAVSLRPSGSREPNHRRDHR